MHWNKTRQGGTYIGPELKNAWKHHKNQKKKKSSKGSAHLGRFEFFLSASAVESPAAAAISGERRGWDQENRRCPVSCIQSKNEVEMFYRTPTRGTPQEHY